MLDGQKGGCANLWHSGVSISPGPPVGSALYMERCPGWGGDTMWADMTAAYDALSTGGGPLRNVVRERSQATRSPTGAMPTTETPSARSTA